ncbi:hypothetical protein QZN11_29560 [Streptomyces gramineus]|uniref:hypothetical protein n=1 Tax=Streptomyces gramineus TaxID=910542 RepID=UPI00398AEA49
MTIAVRAGHCLPPSTDVDVSGGCQLACLVNVERIPIGLPQLSEVSHALHDAITSVTLGRMRSKAGDFSRAVFPTATEKFNAFLAVGGLPSAVAAVIVPVMTGG